MRTSFISLLAWLSACSGLLATDFTTLQPGSLTDFSAAGAFGYLASPPGPGDMVNVLHACTLRNTTGFPAVFGGANG
jgi:hypothetical protein